MSSGSFDMDVPHICGEIIQVTVHWSYRHGVHTLRNGDPGYPDEYDEEWEHEDKCPKCGISLNHDEIFFKTIESMAKEVDAPYEDGPEEPDWEDDDPAEDRMFFH